jgi:thiosulfate dehydrogenase [quinone] large subunit
MKTRPVAKAKAPRSFKLPFKAPPRAWALAEWSLIPLRLFLGVTFLYASLQKLANPDFVHASSGISIQNQLSGAVRTSPIGALIRPLLHIAVPLGITIAIVEVAVAVGTLLGLWGRVAALGGALLSFGLFLTISFHTSPYYFGSDIVFFFAWIPLIIAGSGSRLSMDAVLARRAAHGAAVPDPELVVMPFAQVQKLCGHFSAGKCKVQHNAACQPHGCPVLEGPRPSLPTRGRIDHVDRRAVVLGASSAAVVSAVTAVAAGAAGGLGWALHRKSSSGAPTTTTTTPGGTTTTSSGSNPSGTKIGSAGQVGVNNSASFTVPSNGDPGIVICTKQGQYVAYDAVCTHAGCTVGYSPSSKTIVCPCHGSQYAVATGDVLAGPAPSPLTKFTVTEGSDGNLYLS